MIRKGEIHMKTKLKGFGKEILFFIGTFIACFLLFGALNTNKSVFADSTDHKVNIYVQIEGSLATSPQTITGKLDGDYVEITQALSLSKDSKTYLLKSWGDTTSDGLPKYTYKDVDLASEKAKLGFYMPARDVNIKAVYEEATSYSNNDSNNLRRQVDAENKIGSLWQVSDIYVPTEGETFAVPTDNIASAVIEGVGDSIIYSANPFLSNNAPISRTITFDAGAAGSSTKTVRAGDLIVFPVPYELSGHYINDESVSLTGKGGNITTINNAAAYNGDNTFFLKRYVMDNSKNRYVLMVFTMPNFDVIISANYPTAIPAQDHTSAPIENKELSETINSKGELRINFEDGRAPVLIDTNDIQDNRNKILELQEQLGGRKKIYCYQIGKHIYLVAGDHTNPFVAQNDEGALAIIKAEKNGEPFVEVLGSTITLVPDGNCSWQQVY